MKDTSKVLTINGFYRPPIQGPRDPSHQELLTLKDMARNRQQW